MDVGLNRHVNTMSFNEENLLGMQVKFDWKKIGEVHSNSRRQCLIVCMVCETFENAYTTNDASAFWHHIENQHMDYPLFNGEKIVQKNVGAQSCYDDTNNLSNIRITESNETTNIVHPNNSVSPEKNLLEPNNAQEQRQADLYISDTRLPDTETMDYNTTECQVVAISDDEDVSNDCQIQQDQISDRNVIELSDNEDECIPTEEIESNFATRLKELYSCELCGELFIDQETLNEHKAVHNDVLGNDNVPPSSCQQFPTAFTANEPYLNAAVIGNIRCQFCKVPFASKELVEKHITSIHAVHAVQSRNQVKNLPLQCNACGEYFTSLPHLKVHERNLHKIGIYEELINCAYCEKVVGKYDMGFHISKYHNDTQRQNTSADNSQARLLKYIAKAFKCSICGIRTTTVKSMAVHHQRYHSSTSHPKTTKCEICNKVISVKSLQSHIQSVHSNEGKFKCQFCSRCYRSRKTYEIHLLQSHSKNSFPPVQIVEDSLSSSSLTSHPEVLTEKHSVTPPCQYEENSDNEVMVYGELIPIDSNQSNA